MKQEDQIQISKLEVRDVSGAGLQVFAFIDQEVPCVEFTMKRDHFQPIMYRPTAPVLVYSEPFVQFAPEQWDRMLNKLFTEIVELWNQKHGFTSMKTNE